jgi:hypothetical protein
MPGSAFGGKRERKTAFGYHRSRAGGAGSDRHISEANQQQQRNVTYMPPPEAFFPTTCDIHTGIAGPTPGPSRLQLVSILLTGDYFEGQRQKIVGAQGYTHVALFDPNIELRDLYTGAGSPAGSTPDFLAIPAAQFNNYWKVICSFVTVIPGLGKRKVAILDRFQAPGDWTTLV